MPEKITLTRRFKDWSGHSPYPVEVLVATEDEVLDFANSVRRAGGAEVIDALMPSEPKNSQACLIANSLNFSCRVDSYSSDIRLASSNIKDRGIDWRMYLPHNVTEEQREAIVRETGCELQEPGSNIYRQWALVLPVHIGNAAHAFDSGDGFTKWVTESE